MGVLCPPPVSLLCRHTYFDPIATNEVRLGVMGGEWRKTPFFPSSSEVKGKIQKRPQAKCPPTPGRGLPDGPWGRGWLQTSHLTKRKVFSALGLGEGAAGGRDPQHGGRGSPQRHPQPWGSRSPHPPWPGLSWVSAGSGLPVLVGVCSRAPRAALGALGLPERGFLIGPGVPLACRFPSWLGSPRLLR